MTKSETQDFRIKSWATPTDAEIEQFRALPPATQRRLLEAELKRGEASNDSTKSVADILKGVVSS